MSQSAFYLKINKNTKFALNCFFHWVEIVQALNADYFIVVDDEYVKTTIINLLKSYGIENAKFISSYRKELMPVVNMLGFTGRWPLIGVALLTPFVHAKENGYDYFWNIDADDTCFYCEPQVLIPVFSEAAAYAIENNIDVFSLDMYYSSFKTGHWTFGVAFVDLTNVDFFDCINQLKNKLQNKMALMGFYSIDKVFDYMSSIGLINCKVFSCDGLWFRHAYQAVETWKNGRIIYHEKDAFTQRVVEDKKEIALNPDDIVCLSIKINEKDSSVELGKKYVDRILNISTFVTYTPPKCLTELSNCSLLEAYLYALFSFAKDLVIIISTCDNHTTRSRSNRQLQLLASLGVKTDLQSTYGYSFIAVIDGGKCTKELLSEKSRLITDYIISDCKNERFEITSQGFYTENTNRCNIRIALNGINFAVSTRGLNFVVFDKRNNCIIDSVAFDTFEDNVVCRNINLVPPMSLEKITECTGFIAYILGLNKFSSLIDIFIVSRDAHTNPSRTTSEMLQSMSLLGLRNDFANTYRYSYIGIIKAGNVTAELLSNNKSLKYECEIDGNWVSMESTGYNAVLTDNCPVAIKINGINLAVDKRGLNIVVWDKMENKLLDSVCFDTFLNGAASRKNNL